MIKVFAEKLLGPQKAIYFFKQCVKDSLLFTTYVHINCLWTKLKKIDLASNILKKSKVAGTETKAIQINKMYGI